MVIVMISQMVPYLPSHDGFRLMPANFVKHLSAKHQIYLYAFCNGDETAAQLEWAKPYCSSLKILGPFRHRAKFNNLGYLIRGRRLASNIAAEISALKPDVLHLEGPQMSLVTHSLPLGPLRLLSAHDSLVLRYKQFQRFASARQFFRYMKYKIEGAWIESHWYRRFDRVLVTSQLDRNELARFIPDERVYVLPNGIDLSVWSYKPKPVRHRIVFAGNMSWFPNEDAAEFFARDVFPSILRKVPTAQFWIVGASPSAKVRALAELPSVVVTGTVIDIREFIGAADVYVSPVRFGAGVKNKILEAMAIGPPVVATTSSLTGTPFTEGQDLLIADDAASMASRVLFLFDESEFCRRLSQNARTHLEREYSWEKICERLELLYTSRHTEKPISFQSPI